MKLQPMSKNWNLKETGSNHDQKFICSYKSRQNIWNKIEKSSKIGQSKKDLIFTLACFWLNSPKFSFLKGDYTILGYISFQNWAFFKSRFVTREGFCITKFYIVDVKFPFTFGRFWISKDSKIFWPKFQWYLRGRQKIRIFIFIFILLFLLRGVDIMFDNNCREYSQCWHYSTSECGKITNYKGLRQTELIIRKWDFKSGACLWIPNLRFHLGVSLQGNVYC